MSTLNYLIDEKIDLSVFEARYRNDDGGAPAYDPAILLKIILFAYSKGIIYSRRIEQLCRENVVCMALSADTVPHFTTIAAFVSSLAAEITTIFRNVLLVCDEAGLIGKEMFAIDGVKLPSNASKEWSPPRVTSPRHQFDEQWSSLIDVIGHFEPSVRNASTPMTPYVFLAVDDRAALLHIMPRFVPRASATRFPPMSCAPCLRGVLLSPPRSILCFFRCGSAPQKQDPMPPWSFWGSTRRQCPSMQMRLRSIFQQFAAINPRCNRC